MANTNPDNTVPPQCASCQNTMVMREKEGSKFWGCPNWKECKSKTIPLGGYKKKSYGGSAPPANLVQLEQLKEGMKIMNEKLVGLHKKVDNLHIELTIILEEITASLKK